MGATIFSAKDIAEISLQRIGRFPTTQDQADEVDLKRALEGLELVLQEFAGQQSITQRWDEVDIPLTAGTADYTLSEYMDDDSAQFIYWAKLIDISTPANHDHCDVKLITQRTYQGRDLSCTGRPCESYIDRTDQPVVHVHPILGPEVPAGQYVLRLGVQKYFNKIPRDGKNATKTDLRPSWNLWAINRLAYHLGGGIIRRLPDNELKEIAAVYTAAALGLSAFDNQQTDNQPYIDPWGQ